MSMHLVLRGATPRGLDLVGHGSDRATQMNEASARTKKRGGRGWPVCKTRVTPTNL
jgi:hypothetical protein